MTEVFQEQVKLHKNDKKNNEGTKKQKKQARTAQGRADPQAYHPIHSRNKLPPTC